MIIFKFWLGMWGVGGVYTMRYVQHVLSSTLGKRQKLDPEIVYINSLQFCQH